MRETERVTWPLNILFCPSRWSTNGLLTDKGYATGQNYTMINHSQMSALLRTVKTNIEIWGIALFPSEALNLQTG